MGSVFGLCQTKDTPDLTETTNSPEKDSINKCSTASTKSTDSDCGTGRRKCMALCNNGMPCTCAAKERFDYCGRHMSWVSLNPDERIQRKKQIFINNFGTGGPSVKPLSNPVERFIGNHVSVEI